MRPPDAKARFQENLTLLLNTYVDAAETKDGHILSVSGNQMTTETRVSVRAALFADCSGDGILGALAGAEFRMGRDARAEFGESIAPEKADKKTMGLSCLIQARETDRPQPFIPPAWAYRYDDEGSLPDREHTVTGNQNFWWLEVGGMGDTIHDKEELRDELLKIAFGIWDHIKNRGDHGAENWVLDWVGFLPGKRESRRFVGDHILNQNDVEAAGRHFPDIVAYGGWTMDDHFPEGFYRKEAGTIFHPAPSPYGIPYRCLYSRNIENLFFAGRNISATHSALSSTRVMATCSTLDQAVGTAAAIAAKATLAASGGNPELLRNGYDRQIGGERNSWDASVGDSVVLDLGILTQLRSLRLVFDSDLSRTTHNMVSYYTLAAQDFTVPVQLVKAFTVEADTGDGLWRSVAEVTDNHQRLVCVPLACSARRLRLTAKAIWGATTVHVFALDLE